VGWFDEQIRQRMQSDQETLEDTFARMVNVVLDNWGMDQLRNEREVTREALDDILKYYHQKPSDIPEKIKDPAEQIEYALRPTGIMTREVHLEEGWQQDAYGPLLACLRESGVMVAMMPGRFRGYWFKDPETGKKTRVTRKNWKMFAREALCFYQPLPMKPLKIPDLLLYMRRSLSRADIILIVAATLGAMLVGLIEPRVYHLAAGTILQSRNASLLAGAAVFLIASAFAGQMMEMIKSLLMNRISTKSSISVEASVMMRILSLPVSFFRKYASGELSTRAQSVNSLCNMMLNSILNTGLSSLMSLIFVTQIFQYAPALVWPSLGIVAITVALSVATSLVQMNVSRKQMKLSAEENGLGYAMLSGVQKIKLSGSEKRAFSRWGRVYAQEAELEYDPPTFLKLSRVFVTAVTLASNVLLYYLAIGTGVSGAEYIAFSAAYGRVMAAFNALAGLASIVATFRPVLEMAEPILKATPEVSSEKTQVTSLSGAIDISHVSFRYETNTPYILEDMNLSISAGEYVAIVGRTGCGKSTLVRLLLGFEKPEKGAIFYGNQDMESLDPRSLRKNIGVVTQNGSLFQGDIYSNITISAPTMTLDEAWEVAEIAGIADDIRAMPMGMNTVLSEGQGGISGGQKQRLMIARAIAPKPKILIFDEATSALDNMTQRQVSDALDGLRCTRIVIAHRLSTIQNCDRILVMDRGRIIEEGTYQQLIEKNGAFADLVARQRLDQEELQPKQEEDEQAQPLQT